LHVRILTISATLTVVCVAMGVSLASPVSPLAADVPDQPGRVDYSANSDASAPSAAADPVDESGDSFGRPHPRSGATGSAYTTGTGTPTPHAGPTLPTLPTDLASILPTVAPTWAPSESASQPPNGTTSPTGSPSSSPTAAPTGGPTLVPTLGPSPTADPTRSPGDDPTAGGDDGLLCRILPLLCG